MMKLDKYMDVIERKVIPERKDRYERGISGGGVIFKQDLAPCLSSKKVKTIFRQYNLNVLDFPGYSLEIVTSLRICDQ